MNAVAWLFLRLTCGALLFLLTTSTQAEGGRAYLSTHSLSGSVGIKSWKTLRDERVVKQDLDYSCGAASLATLLNEHYGQNLSERELLQAMDTGDFVASFEDMQRALSQFGFRAVGFSASYEQLAKLKVPVIVYLEHRKTEHFSVLRGIDESTVWLADPSQGNRTYKPVAIPGHVGHARGCTGGKGAGGVPRHIRAGHNYRLFHQDPEAANGLGCGTA